MGTGLIPGRYLEAQISGGLRVCSLAISHESCSLVLISRSKRETGGLKNCCAGREYSGTHTVVHREKESLYRSWSDKREGVGRGIDIKTVMMRSVTTFMKRGIFRRL